MKPAWLTTNSLRWRGPVVGEREQVVIVDWIRWHKERSLKGLGRSQPGPQRLMKVFIVLFLNNICKIASKISRAHRKRVKNMA